MSAQPSTVNEATRLALAALSRVAEPDDPVLFTLLAEVGATEAWERTRRGDPRLPERYRARTAARLPVTPEDDLERAAEVGARLVCPGDDEWPELPGDLSAWRCAPRALWVRGSASLCEVVPRSVAVVGARAATSYGVHVADDIAAGLADAGFTVVSGGAVGIDAAAHRAALAAGGLTVAVLACGVDVAYPPGNRRLLQQVADGGALVSEWPPGCSPMRHRFLVRNRLLAALSSGTVVVEAARRSGSLSTLHWAVRLRLPGMVVPGPVTSALSAGCHDRLRDQEATCVTSAAEVIELVGRLGADAAPPQSGAARPRDALGPEAALVLEATPVRAWVHPDRIAATAGLPALRVASLLNQLCASGFVEAGDAGYRLSAAQRRGRWERAGA